MNTTLNNIRKHSPCSSGWTKLLKSLNKTTADDEVLEMSTILNSNGLDDAIWCLRSIEGIDKECKLFAVFCARQVQHLNDDPRVSNAIDVAERFANGNTTLEKLLAARSAAYNAARSAARSAAYAAARSAAYYARDAASYARDAASYARDAAAPDAAPDVTHESQKQKFIEMFC